MTKKTYRLNKKAYRKQYKLSKKELKNNYKNIRKNLRNQYISEIDLESKEKQIVNPPYRTILEEIGNSVTHGIGSILSIVFYVLMLIHSNTVNEYIASTIYFLGLFFEFTMSTLYHAFPYGSKVKRIFRRFDYSSIYLLIGASFAPILLCYIGGIYGTIFVIIQWIIIITGVTLVAVFGLGMRLTDNAPADLLRPKPPKKGKRILLFGRVSVACLPGRAVACRFGRTNLGFSIP